jgi:hypothetical protein
LLPNADLADVIKNLRGVLIFNAVFIPILVLCLGATAYFVQKEFRQLAEQQILENAHLMMETAKASRNYTTEQIEPLLTHEETRVADGVKTLNDVINRHTGMGSRPRKHLQQEPGESRASRLSGHARGPITLLLCADPS